MKIFLYLFGKFCITIAFTVVYVYTTELFPTQLRHSLLGTCSMFGRMGSIVAPQTPLLVNIDAHKTIIMNWIFIYYIIGIFSERLHGEFAFTFIRWNVYSIRLYGAVFPRDFKYQIAGHHWRSREHIEIEKQQVTGETTFKKRLVI